MPDAEPSDLRRSPCTHVASFDLWQQLRAMIHTLCPPRPRTRPERPSPVDVPNSRHSVAWRLQHAASYPATPNIVTQDFEIRLVADVAGRPESELPDSDLGALKQKPPAHGRQTSEDIGIIGFTPRRESGTTESGDRK